MLHDYKSIYGKELSENIIPFWQNHCVDKEYGGYFTCLDRDGSVYDTEKFMWMQWRIVWMFSELYNKLDNSRSDWLAIAKNGYDFLESHGKDENGWYYFSLNREGVPAMAPYNAFSDCFAVMGAAAYGRAANNPKAQAEAQRAFDVYSMREDNPKGRWSKELEGKTKYSSLGFYMMKLNLMEVLSDNLGVDNLKEIIDTIDFVLDTFWSPEFNVMFENMPMNKKPDLESMPGRHTNPGHVLEAMWFILNSANRANRPDIIAKASNIILATLDYGWDDKYGGMYYFKDVLGKPHMELQWNMKLWWVHNEAIIAAYLAYKYTKDERFVDWFVKLHNWTWTHFPDPEYGEWFAYLNREGQPTHMLKGGKWKTFFHVPRMLLNVSIN